MAKSLEETKARTKEAAGVLTDNDKLRREGKVDRVASQVKEKVDDAVDSVRDKAHKHDGK